MTADGKFHHHYCVLVVPFERQSLEIDEEQFRRLIRYLVSSELFLEANGALIVNGEAGEVFYMTAGERGRLIAIALEERPDGMPIFAGCYGVSRGEIIESAIQAKEAGVDGIFVLPPAGTMEVSTSIDAAGNPEIWTAHVKAIADATNLPIIVHATNPWTREWGFGLPIESVAMVIEYVPNVVGWKMIYGNAIAHFRVANYLRSFERDIAILNAPHYSYHTASISGLLDGTALGVSNFAMESVVGHELAWKNGDYTRAFELWNREVRPILEYITADHSRLHIRYKLAAWIRGFMSHPFMRPPMPPPRRGEAEEVYRVISNAGLSHIDRDSFEFTLDHVTEVLGTDNVLERRA